MEGVFFKNLTKNILNKKIEIKLFHTNKKNFNKKFLYFIRILNNKFSIKGVVVPLSLNFYQEQILNKASKFHLNKAIKGHKSLVRPIT